MKSYQIVTRSVVIREYIVEAESPEDAVEVFHTTDDLQPTDRDGDTLTEDIDQVNEYQAVLA